MIQTKAELKLYLQEDAKANGIVLGMSYLIKLFYGNINACAYRYLKSLRKYEYYHNVKSILRYWWRFYNRRLGLRYHLAIPINAVGKGLYLPHLEGGIIINCKSMGYNCSVNAGVIIGNKDSQANISTIGNNVSFSIGCKIIGKVIIGDNSVIAPNSVVIKDVPPNSAVSGVPAKIIKQN